MGFTTTLSLPTKEYFRPGHVNSNDVAALPADSRVCQICMTELEKITTMDLSRNPDLTEDCAATCGPVGSQCRKHHIFHAKCINTWLEMNNTCPTCRTEVYKREETEDEDIVFSDDDSDDEATAAEDPDDYADYLRHIHNVVPDSVEQEHAQGLPLWFEVHADWLQRIISDRVQAYRANNSADRDEELWRDSTTIIPFGNRPALSGYQDFGVVNARKLTTHLRRFFWNTFALSTPRYTTTNTWGAACHPAAMAAWQKLTSAIRAKDGWRMTVPVLLAVLTNAVEDAEVSTPAAVLPFIEAMIEEALLAFEVSAKAANEKRRHGMFARRRTMRISPAWMAHQRQMRRLQARR